MKVRIKKLNPDAKMPTKATPGSSGYDLYATEDAMICPGQVVAVPTGLSMEIPKGFEVQIRPRSGLCFMAGLTVANTPGTIDSDYRGEVKVLMTMIAKGPNAAYKVMKGSRIAQMVVSYVPDVPLEEETEELSDTARGDGGFGSSGT